LRASPWLHLVATLSLAGTLSAGASGSGEFRYVTAISELLAEQTVVIDTRHRSACEQRSLRGARCLPAADFLGPHRRLASFRDITWILGTAGLAGDEHVVVVGDDPSARDFVAGLLYLAGQARVGVFSAAVFGAESALPAESFDRGRPRGPFRDPVFHARARDEWIVLRDELAQALHAPGKYVMIDGRSEEEYWGQRVRASRGGHLPGAWWYSAAWLREQLAAGGTPQLPVAVPLVVYAHDAFDSVAMFTLVSAGTGRATRVYLDGWADWAAHATLPADSVTYPERQAARVAQPPSAGPQTPRPASGVPWLLLLLGMAVGIGLTLLVVFVTGRGRASHGRTV
jgi:thiosulfate/3-mercaptopyruvate sulfurtransferase